MSNIYLRKPKTIFINAFLSVFVLITASCSVNKNVPYFQNLSDTTKVASEVLAEYKEPVIQPDDIMSINIETIDPQNSSVLNQVSTSLSVGASSASTIGSQQVTGFLVDKNGYVEIPILGQIKLLGLTTFEARELIRQKALVFFKEPSVQVRFANFKITVIGEVSKPAAYTLPNEKVTVLDAIGMAGDLTIYGRRENVLVIRQVDGAQKFARLNLNSTDIFKSPYYYLKQNDVVYVEPNKAKIVSTDAANTRAVTITVSILSAVLLILYRIL
jgi:polysaccharide export outer membrane protein